MKKVLLTSFEPFGGMKYNSSVLVIDKLKDRYKNIILLKKTLPVLYEKAFDILKETIKTESLNIVICMGQAGGRSKLTLEKIAVNINSGHMADNGGVLKNDEIIEKNGAEAYFTNLPYQTMLKEPFNSVTLSYSAGTFICNDIFYRLMHWIYSEELPIKGGFLHLPYTEHFSKMPFMKLKTQVKSVETMLELAGGNDEY